jgi:hypothetical protein
MAIRRIITADQVETRIQNATSCLDADGLVDLHNIVSYGKIELIDYDKFELTFDSEEDAMNFEDEENS